MSIRKKLAEAGIGFPKPTANGHPAAPEPNGPADAPREQQDTNRPPFELIPEWVGKKCKITAKVRGVVVHLHTFDPASHTQRAKFARTVHEKRPAVPAELVETELLKLAERGGETRRTKPTAPHTLAEPSADIRADAEALLADPQLVRRVCDDIAALGVVGERELALTVYLIGVSRLLPKPLAGIVRGSSTSGKSFIVEHVATLFPPEAVILLGGGVSDSARRFFEKLKGWADGEFTAADAKRRAIGGKSSVYGWLAELYEAGALEQTEPGRGRTPAKWKLSGRDPAPGSAIIPAVEDIFPDAENGGHDAQPV